MIQEPNQNACPRATGAAPWLVVVLSAVAGGLLVELGRTATAGGQGMGLEPVGAAGRSMIVAPAQLSRDAYGVYVVDAELGKICLYEYRAAEQQLRLLAVRNFTYDMRLDDYHTQPPPSEMKLLSEALMPAEPSAPAEPATKPAEGFPVERSPAEE